MGERDSEISNTDIPLAEMIESLRYELEAAQENSSDAGILFDVEKVELELKVAVSRKTKGQGGVEFYVVKVGGELEKSGETVHTFKLTLIPVSAVTGKRTRVADRTRVKQSRE